MSEGPSEGGSVRIVFPRGLDETPSPDPDSGKRYTTLLDSQELGSRTKYEHYKGFSNIINTKVSSLSSCCGPLVV